MLRKSWLQPWRKRVIDPHGIGIVEKICHERSIAGAPSPWDSDLCPFLVLTADYYRDSRLDTFPAMAIE
jgi:hypothetical protein